MHDLVFFDDNCGFCDFYIRLLARRDRQGFLFRFAPLGGRAYEEAFTPHERAALPESIVVLLADGSTLVRSRAIAHLSRQLDGYWTLVHWAMTITPRPIADRVYDLIAALRKLLPQRRTCAVLSPEVRARFWD